MPLIKAIVVTCDFADQKFGVTIKLQWRHVYFTIDSNIQQSYWMQIGTLQGLRFWNFLWTCTLPYSVRTHALDGQNVSLQET